MHFEIVEWPLIQDEISLSVAMKFSGSENSGSSKEIHFQFLHFLFTLASSRVNSFVVAPAN